MADPTAAPVDDRGGGGPSTGLGLQASGRRLGHYVWLEQWLFETLGEWAGDTIGPDLAVVLAAHSRHHGWRAAQWRPLLPALADLDPESLVVPPSATLAARLADLRRPPRLGGSPAHPALTHRVVIPRLVSAYERHLGLCRPAADGPVRRMLELVVFDTRRDLASADSLLAVDDATVAATAQAVDGAVGDGEDLAGPL